MRSTALARCLAVAATMFLACGDDGVSSTGSATDTEGASSTGSADTGSPAGTTTGAADSTMGAGTDTGMQSTGTAADATAADTQGEVTGTGTSTGGTDADASGSTTQAAFVCEPESLGSAIGRVVTGTTLGEQNDILVPCMKFDSVELEYEWSAPADGTYQIDTYGSTYDTALMVLATDCDGAQLACNDDIGTHESAVLVTLNAGDTILVVVDGFGGATGDFVLNIDEAQPGDCCTPGPFAGCNEPACQDAVCAADPSCCNEDWDSHCAQTLAPQLCAECAPPGSCCFAHEDPGCDEVSCEQDICDIDPTCCTVEYTQACADLANEQCFECQPNIGDCCSTHMGPGCQDLACEIEVCMIGDPFCCEFNWDPMCADLAQEHCSVCQEPGPCCVANFGTGCEDLPVQDCVCATLPECCTGQWTQACADQVEAGACATCLDPDFSCVDTNLGSATGEVATGTNVGAGNDYTLGCTPPGGEEVIFQWTSPSTGVWVFDTYGADYDVGLGLLYPDCAATPPLECDADFNQFAQEIQLEVPQGVTVAIVIDGYGPTSGNYVLNINPEPGDGFCCLANGSPGCAVASCENEVCLADPSCCAGVWDADCAALAQATCAACEPGALADCCTGNPGTPGCEDFACAENVCSFDPFCCNESWEPWCADGAEMWCGNLCN